jgi:hypothetical protein
MASSLEVLNAAQLSFWANKPTASLYNSSTFTAPNAAETAITWNASKDDNWSGHSSVTNPSRYTAQVAGVYRFSGAITYNANATGYRLGQWYYNGSEYNGNARVYITPSTVSNNTVAMSDLKIRMAVGDYVEMFTYQTSGAGLATTDGTWFDVEFVHF